MKKNTKRRNSKEKYREKVLLPYSADLIIRILLITAICEARNKKNPNSSYARTLLNKLLPITPKGKAFVWWVVMDTRIDDLQRLLAQAETDPQQNQKG